MKKVRTLTLISAIFILATLLSGCLRTAPPPDEGEPTSDMSKIVETMAAETPVATVRIVRGGEESEVTAEGDGMVNAAFVALQDAFGFPAILLDYRVNPFTSGADAMAEVNVIIQIGPLTYSGRGISTDVVEGSARAFVASLNKALADRNGTSEVAGS